MNPTDIRTILRKNLAGPDGSCVMSGSALSKAAHAVHKAMDVKPPSLAVLNNPAIELGALRAKVFNLENQIKDLTNKPMLMFGTP